VTGSATRSSGPKVAFTPSLNKQPSEKGISEEGWVGGRSKELDGKGLATSRGKHLLR